LPLPFLVIRTRPLRAIARWPHAPAKSLRSENNARHAGFHHRVEPDVRRDASRISPMASSGRGLMAETADLRGDLVEAATACSALGDVRRFNVEWNVHDAAGVGESGRLGNRRRPPGLLALHPIDGTCPWRGGRAGR